ncbi:MAG: hypothetical protein ABSD28_12265 [Tepidisphaeraceae bacterium]|jgi:hypothetical protein
MAKTTKPTEDLAAKLADLGRAGSTAMQPAVMHAMNPPAHTPSSVKPQGRGVEELVKITVRLTDDENRRLIHVRNELSEQHARALNTTDVLRLALTTFEQPRVTAQLVAQILSTDRRRKSD